MTLTLDALKDVNWNEIQTPAYLYSELALDQLISQMRQSFPPTVHVHFALKANNNVHVLQFLKRKGLGIDAVSGNEVLWALEQGFSPDDIIFSGVGKTRAELRLALEQNIFMLNLESVSEADRLEEEAARLSKTCRTTLRLNPNVDAKSHPYISTGLNQHKFGLSMDEGLDLYIKLFKSKNCLPVGMSMHIGSQMMNLDALEEASQILLRAAEKIKSKGHSLQVLDLGGGLGVDYSLKNELPHFAAYGKLLSKVEAAWKKLFGEKATVCCELGRALVAQAGWLVTRVIGTKSNPRKNFLIVDASMSELLRPALYQADHPVAVHVLGGHPLTLDTMNDSNKEVNRSLAYDIVGPVCESSDVLKHDAWLPELCEGDVLTLGAAGAYGHVMSSSYNMRSVPPEYWIHTDKKIVLSRPPLAPPGLSKIV